MVVGVCVCVFVFLFVFLFFVCFCVKVEHGRAHELDAKGFFLVGQSREIGFRKFWYFTMTRFFIFEKRHRCTIACVPKSCE